jgi:hypothetical protein
MTAFFVLIFKFWTDLKSKKRELQLKKGINQLTISTRKGAKRAHLETRGAILGRKMDQDGSETKA